VARIADGLSGEQTFSTLPAARHNRGIVLWQGSSCRAAAIMSKIRNAKYQIGQVVRHRLYPFRGVVFDIDPTFSNTDEWYDAIPAEIRPHKDQPFYHLSPNRISCRTTAANRCGTRRSPKFSCRTATAIIARARQ
jgi:hypothetical protein